MVKISENGGENMTTKEKAILWLNSFVKNKEPMTLIPKQLIRLMYEALTEQPDIVRCKDCKHYRPGRLIECAKIHHSKQSREWFCADGERRD